MVEESFSPSLLPYPCRSWQGPRRPKKSSVYAKTKLTFSPFHLYTYILILVVNGCCYLLHRGLHLVEERTGGKSYELCSTLTPIGYRRVSATVFSWKWWEDQPQMRRVDFAQPRVRVADMQLSQPQSARAGVRKTEQGARMTASLKKAEHPHSSKCHRLESKEDRRVLQYRNIFGGELVHKKFAKPNIQPEGFEGPR
ncbi:hypothetical protein BJ170DRAFT_436358 [Xylariales sp. AK1849]|nr:hypothetical protein BJ170DRAFT_436358 [Xylariales sp. AK1849]